MRASVSVFFSSLSLLVTACSRDVAPRPVVAAPAPRPDASVSTPGDSADQSLRRAVESGLLPMVVVRGAPPKSLAERMQHFAVPGVSVALVRERKVSWAGAYGVKDASAPGAVSPETLFQAGSLSKPVAALAMMRMVQDGELTLDEDVTKRLVSWRLPADDRTKIEKVTLRLLASHSSGLGVHGFGGYEVGAPIPTAVEVLDGRPPATSPPVRLEAVPGVKMTYSGGGFTLMQQLMTDVAKQTFPEIVKTRVFDRLGLTRSTFLQPLPVAARGDAAAGHTDGVPIAGKWRVHPELAAAGLWTTPGELARIIAELESALEGRSDRLLTASSAREMLTAQKTGFGLGFAVEGEGRDFRFSHGGANVGFEAYFVAFPARGEGVVVMTNGNGGSKLAKEIIRAVAHAQGWPGYAPIERVVATVSSDALRACAGSYVVTIDPKTQQRFEIAVDGGGLVLRAAGDRPQRWLPMSETAFFTEDSETTFEVVKTADVVSELVIRQDNNVYHALKSK